MNKCDHCKQADGNISYVTVTRHGNDKMEATQLFHLCGKCAVDLVKWVFNK